MGEERREGMMGRVGGTEEGGDDEQGGRDRGGRG